MTIESGDKFGNGDGPEDEDEELTRKKEREAERRVEIEKLPIFDTVKRMEQAEDVEEMKKLVPEFLGQLREDLGIELTDDVTSLYKEMQDKHFLVRLENLGKVLRSLRDKLPFEVGGASDHYANAVIPESDGLRIAFSEGDAVGPARILIGFDVKSAVSFDPKDLEISSIDADKLDPFRDQAKRAALCRHISGKLKPEDIKHLIIRIPRKMFPEKEFTEEEIGKEDPFIFRGARVSAEDKLEEDS